MPTTVTYDGIEITPAPFISRSIEPIDFGKRWGVVHNVTLNGYLTGTTGVCLISGVCGIFSRGFRDLIVSSDGDSEYYVAKNCVLSEISIGSNSFFTGSENFIPYTVNLKSYGVQSGVIDISNKYNYADNQDGTVTVNREISARGIKTDNEDALDNAIAFVSRLTGVNPVRSVSPEYIPSGEAVLLSWSESVNRMDGSYSVSESWKYQTGTTAPYITTKRLNISEEIGADYTNLDLEISIQSHRQSGISHVRNYLRDIDFYDSLSKYGVATGQCVLNSFSSQESPSESRIDFKLGYISGVGAEISTGIFNNTLSLDHDEIRDVKVWGIVSDLKMRGPNSHKINLISGQKANIVTQYGDYVSFLYRQIVTSNLYSVFATGGYQLSPIPLEFNADEQDSPALYKLTAKFSDASWKKIDNRTLPNGNGTIPISIGDSSWKLQISPEMWIFESSPAANIEGHSVVQDIQCKGREKISISASTEHPDGSYYAGLYANRYNSYTGNNGIVTGLLNALSGLTAGNAFYITDQSNSSGVFNFEASASYLAKTGLCPKMTESKVFGSVNNGYNTRAPRKPWGY